MTERPLRDGAASPPRMPPRLLLVRHGPTPWNEAGRYQGWSDPDLSEEGVRAARRLAMTLKSDPRAAGTGPVWSSDLRRAVGTARVVFPGEAPRIDPRLRELAFGAFEGGTHAENLERWPEAYRLWLSDPERHPPPGGEPLGAFRSRVEAWLSQAAEEARPEEMVRAVAHGGVVRMVVAILRGVPFQVATDPGGPVAAPKPGEALLLEGETRGWIAVPLEGASREPPTPGCT